MMINIMTRQKWHALKPRKEALLLCPPNNIFLMNVRFETCSTTTHCTMLVNNTQRFNVKSGTLRDIRHNFVIGGDGNVYEGRGWYTAPLVPKQYYNYPDSFIIGFLGNFSKETLPKVMQDAADALIEYGQHEGYLEKDLTFYDLLSIATPKNRDTY